MAYGVFAAFYDNLTANVEYDKRAAYICSLLEAKGFSGGTLLDIACGTGSLTVRFCKMGFDVIGVDNSPDMLSIARNKLYDWGCDAMLLCQDMCELDLYGNIDAAVCSLDSLNHITDEKKLSEAIRRISIFMNPGGIFVFDLNTAYKHREILSDNTFVYELDDVFCVWQNECLKDDIVNINLDFFVKSGNNYIRYTEHFCEKAYKDEVIISILKETGFELVERYNELSFNTPDEKSERIYYVARKIID